MKTVMEVWMYYSLDAWHADQRNLRANAAALHRALCSVSLYLRRAVGSFTLNPRRRALGARHHPLPRLQGRMARERERKEAGLCGCPIYAASPPSSPSHSSPTICPDTIPPAQPTHTHTRDRCMPLFVRRASEIQKHMLGSGRLRGGYAHARERQKKLSRTGVREGGYQDMRACVGSDAVHVRLRRPRHAR
ncbi:hypothetical protein COCSADRAFT_205150 [Bipolaris sorokiniana ND90Pr]|uniref:Uncharacterized protein n=1 Tax=Cochliobolus sativus (strain ND90Pr / ATCC 201652) TaxID=665912 RepID=M2TJY5_COCSN|nr:uncharacterized protein COCSADRAFT_205150 [Bipolaris sorokiniana ND90Pr]EMD69007.1 hypothetical protein COCSADRAFT_205150 [Bipolaris sorokiniana ND90Pr]